MSTTTRVHPNDLVPKHDPYERLTKAQAEYVDGLREIADFLVEHPEFISEHDHLSLRDYCSRRSEMVERAREIGGRFEKDASHAGTYFQLTRRFGPHEVYVYTERTNVCERVVTTETVTSEVPDPELLAEVPTVTVTETVEHVEWKCPDSLLSSPPVAADAFDTGAPVSEEAPAF